MIPYAFPHPTDIKFIDKDEYGEPCHLYTLNGSWVMGVSSACDCIPKPWLVPWGKKMMGERIKELWDRDNLPANEDELDALIKDAKKASDRKADEGKTRGTNAHDWIESHIAGKDLPPPTEAGEMMAVTIFLAWEKMANPKYLASEQVVASVTHKYAGTLDIVARINKRTTLVDLKTNANISESWWPQTAAYVHAWEEMGGEKIQDRLVVRLPAEGLRMSNVPYPIMSPQASDFEWFLALKTVYHKIQNLKQTKTKKEK